MRQHTAFENAYADPSRWAFHDTDDPLIRYLRDRRIRIGVEHVMRVVRSSPATWDALVVCGGVGGEGTLLANLGFASVTVSDYSENALAVCRRRDPRLQTRPMNAEQMDLPDGAYDLVLVQDGLHHLSRPVQGFTEMLRVARRGVLVMEPHWGLVAKLLGTTWEDHGGEVNFVFRWNQMLLEQAARSYLLRQPCYIKALRLWDHASAVHRLASRLPSGSSQRALARACYGILDGLFRPLGNAMIGVVVKNPSA
jgi:ubiquinone/menaquinone biosynthesis C-methylase UbiE